MDIQSVVLPIIGIIAGWLIGYLAMRGPRNAEREQNQELEKQLEESRVEARGLDEKLHATREELVAERTRAETLRNDIARLDREMTTLKNTVQAADTQVRTYMQENGELRTTLRNEQENAAEKLRLLKEAKDELTNAFDSLSKRALQHNNQSFLDLAKESLSKYQESAKGDLEKKQQAISELLTPLKENLERLDTQNRTIEQARQHAYSTLTEQVRALSEGQTQLRSETSNLVRALRAPQGRGRWGEVQLRRVAEMAGMLNYCDFAEQVIEETEEGRKKPDMIVRLPGEKNVIVDAKVPLAAYLEALEATDDLTRTAKLKQHAQQVRSRIKDLSGKSYWAQFQPTPEFVVLFLPGESLLYAALEHDPQLIEDGMTDYVILATPTTLIAMLKAIYYGWKQENIAENAREISELGAELYKRIATLGDHFARLGSNLGKAVESFNSSVGSLERNVLSTARKLKEHDISTGDKEVAEIDHIETNVRVLDRIEFRAPEALPATGGDGQLFQ
jgi:DNA recombination protein RmuC